MKKTIAIVAVILVIFNFVATIGANFYACVTFDEQITTQNSSMVNMLAKTVTSENSRVTPELEKDYVNNKLHFYLNGYSMSTPYTASHYAVYDSKNNLICETDDNILIIESNAKSDEPGSTRVCTVKNKDEVYDFINSYMSKYSDVAPSVLSTARKDLECYITEMNLEYSENGESKNTTYKFEGKIEPDFEKVKRTETNVLLMAIGLKPEFPGYSNIIKPIYIKLCERNEKRFDECTITTFGLLFSNSKRLHIFSIRNRTK